MGVGPLRSGDEIVVFTSKWTIGATGAHTKSTSNPSTGFASVARTAAGKYTVTFANGMPTGGLLDLQVTHHAAANASGFLCRQTLNSYTAETASAAATVKYESWDLATPGQIELNSADVVVMKAYWLKTRLPA